MHRANLVIVRAGDTSFHSQWLERDPERDWDLIVSYYGDNDVAYRDDRYATVMCKGPKLSGIKQLFADDPELIERYERVFFPDDDLELIAGTISEFLKYCSSSDLALAQPSLSHDSFVSRVVTLYNPVSLVRYTNWVECMAPCFSREALALCLATFDETLTGWGLDNLWCAMMSSVGLGMGIVDAIQMRHTRPYGGPNYQHVRDLGSSAMCELLTLQKKYGVRQPIIEILKYIDLEGNHKSLGQDDPNSERWIVPPW